MLVGAGLVLYPCWVGGTALGALAGDILGDPERSRPRRRLAGALPRPARHAGRQLAATIAAALAGGTIALVLLPFTPAGVPVIAAGAVCLAGAARDERDLDRRRCSWARSRSPSRRRARSCSAVAKLPARLSGALELLAPSLLAALVVTQAVGGDEEIVLDERLVGVGAGALAISLRAPLIVVIVVAALATALARLL